MVSVDYQADYPADAATVRAILLDPAFLAAYAAKLGALDYTATVEDAGAEQRTRLELTAPTAGLPSLLQRFVGATARISDVRSWGRPRAGLVRGEAAVDVAQAASTARLTAELLLADRDEGCRFSVHGTLSIKVPLVARQAEGFARPLVLASLRDESEVLRAWLSEGAARG